MTKKNTSSKKKLLPAAGMLALSAAMLASSTYAWFTMNKEVSVTGMEMKAHSEEGLLINEVKLATSTTWDNQATANTTPSLIALRPASTQNFTKWWHANSKVSADEAGVGDDQANTVAISNGVYYKEVTAGADGIKDKVFVDAETATGDGVTKATGNTMAETHVYYDDASFGAKPAGAGDTYDPGEGYYIKYTYYLKSSGEGTLTINDFRAKVTATKKALTAEESAQTDTTESAELNKALRVGVEYQGQKMIFAPVSDADSSYQVTTNAGGTAGDVVNYTTSTDYVQINKIGNAAATPVTVPSVTTDGAPVYVYLWFEGEDTHCNSDNIKAILNTYDIDISFKDADLV